MKLAYPSGEEVLAGDLLGPKNWSDGQSSRVVVVIPTRQSAPDYNANDWSYLEAGVLVEHTNASGTVVVYYPSIDEDFMLLARANPEPDLEA